MLQNCGKCYGNRKLGHCDTKNCIRPIGVVAGSVNKAGQTAAEIIKEMALDQSVNFVNAAAKLLTRGE